MISIFNDKTGMWRRSIAYKDAGTEIVVPSANVLIPFVPATFSMSRPHFILILRSGGSPISSFQVI